MSESTSYQKDSPVPLFQRLCAGVSILSSKFSVKFLRTPVHRKVSIVFLGIHKSFMKLRLMMEDRNERGKEKVGMRSLSREERRRNLIFEKQHFARGSFEPKWLSCWTKRMERRKVESENENIWVRIQDTFFLLLLRIFVRTKIFTDLLTMQRNDALL